MPGVTGVLEVLNMTTTLLRLILPWRSPTTSATSRAFVLRFAHDSGKKSVVAMSYPGRKPDVNGA